MVIRYLENTIMATDRYDILNRQVPNNLTTKIPNKKIKKEKKKLEITEIKTLKHKNIISKFQSGALPKLTYHSDNNEF